MTLTRSITSFEWFQQMLKHPDVLAISVCLSSLSHLAVHFSFRLSRLHGIKITQRKAENQIKMAKMIMMNELNKRANLLIEQLEVITFSPRFPLRLSKRIHLQTSSWLWMYWWWSVRNRTSSERIMQNRQIPPSSDISKQMGILGKVMRGSMFLSLSSGAEYLQWFQATSGGPAAGGHWTVQPAGACAELHYLGYGQPQTQSAAIQQRAGRIFSTSKWALDVKIPGSCLLCFWQVSKRCQRY